MLWYQHEEIHIGQGKGRERPESYPYIYGHLIFDKSTKKNIVPSKNSTRKMGYTYDLNYDPYLISCTKLSLNKYRFKYKS